MEQGGGRPRFKPEAQPTVPQSGAEAIANPQITATVEKTKHAVRQHQRELYGQGRAKVTIGLPIQEEGTTAEHQTAVYKLRSIHAQEGIPPEVQETMDRVGEMFAREMPEISSGALLSTRIKSNRQ